MEPVNPPLNRRGFLKIGLLSGALLATGSAVVLTGSSAHYRQLLPADVEAQPPQVLSLRELAILTVFADRIVPDETGYLSARAANVARRIDLELSFHGEKLQSDIKSALLLLEHGGLLHGRFRRFTALSPEAQDAAIEQLAVNGYELERQALSGLRLMVLFYYYTDERTWPAIHYQGPQMPRKAPEADNRVG